jgi:hypothetical protein
LLFPDPRPLVERLGEAFFRQLPERPGVYLMQDATGLVLYVGKARSLRQRLGHYRVANPDRMGRRHLRLLRQVARIELQECADEMAALAREAELIRTLKPRFNRAGVWPAPPRFLAWRRAGNILDLAITKTPTTGWQVLGPWGSGAVFMRCALARLLWYAQNPDSGSVSMPQGWLHGRLGATVSIEAVHGEVDLVLTRLFEGDANGFVTWIGERTQSLAKGYDLEIRDGDLETVTRFMQARARRTLPLQTPDPGWTNSQTDQESLLPFEDEDEALT